MIYKDILNLLGEKSALTTGEIALELGLTKTQVRGAIGLVKRTRPGTIRGLYDFTEGTYNFKQGERQRWSKV